MRSLISGFVNDDSGVTAIEYGLIAAGVGLAVLAVAGPLGDAIKAVFETITTKLKPAS